MILFSLPADQIGVGFTLPGHWRSTVFIFTIDLITFFGQQYLILLLFFLFAVFFICLLKYFLLGRIHTASRQTQTVLFIQTTTCILTITGKPIQTDARS